MTTARELFVDTNILIYFSNALSPFRNAATTALQTARQSGTDLIISQQILREYLATATRLSLTGNGPALADIVQNINNFRADFRVVADTPQVFDNLVTLVQATPMGGKQVHDANIVATMQTHGISHLLTHNTADFARFSSIITVVPLLSTP